MRSFSRSRGHALASLAIALLAWSSLGSAQDADQAPASVELIANPETNLAELDQDALLRAVFTLRTRTWADGTPVRIFVFPEQHPAHQSLCRNLLGTFPYVLRRAWDQALFAGTGLVPQVVESVDEMVRRVKETPGALGYVPIDSRVWVPRGSVALPTLAASELKS